MDHLMVFDEKEKKRIGTISFIPAVCFFIALLYYLILIVPIDRADIPNTVAGVTAHHYSTLFAMLAVSAIVSAGVLIYNLVMLARVKNMNAPEKLIWVLILATFVPLSFIAFWYFVVRKEPKYVGIHPDIV
jgi:amino acid permease